MTLEQVAALRRLLLDPLERERLRCDVEALVGAMHETMAVPAEVEALVGAIAMERQRPREALQLAREAYVRLFLGLMDDGEVEHGMLALLANVCAALAVLAGRDHEARRWLRVAESEATADGLDGGEVLVAWLGAVEMVARSMDPGSADGVLGP